MDTLLDLIRHLLQESEREPLFLSLQFTRYRWKKPDEERFFQEILSQCSRLRAMFHVCGLDPLTSWGIYQFTRVVANRVSVEVGIKSTREGERPFLPLCACPLIAI
jgi:hypothetical protein